MRSDVSPRVKSYEVFFGFREPPFSLAPDPRFLFDAASHAAAREQVARAMERREPLVVVTGEIGTGKTLLCRSVVQKLASRTFLSIVHDPMLDRDDLLKQMLQDFGVISKDRTRLAPTTRHELVHALQEFLLSLVPLKGHAVLVIDEAQHLQADVVEQLRLVSNVHDEGGTLLQIVLVGQPSLETVLARPELRQVKQRVSRHVRLEPLGIAELSQYIEHRLAVAREGGSASPGAVAFAPEALSAIWRLSGGTPRIINLLCDRALEAAYEQQARSVGAPHVEAAAEELGIAAVAPAIPAAETPAPARVAVPPSMPPMPDVEFEPALAGVPAVEAAPRAKSGIFVAAAVVAVVAAAAWFMVRALYPPTQTESSFPGAAPPPAERRPPPAAMPPEPAAAVPAPAPPPVTPQPVAPPPATTAQPTPTASEPVRAPSSDSFEIVVASFRTMTRATEVAAELTALGQPVRQRLSDGWQQVLAGPFASRADAEEAQAKLDRAGYTGTQIVPAAR
jgi:general secretion pathway protein A